MLPGRYLPKEKLSPNVPLFCRRGSIHWGRKMTAGEVRPRRFTPAGLSIARQLAAAPACDPGLPPSRYSADELVSIMWALPAQTPQGRRSKLLVLLGYIMDEFWRHQDDMKPAAKSSRRVFACHCCPVGGAILGNQFQSRALARGHAVADAASLFFATGWLPVLKRS
jgi:hypothetical protein